ncbi:uncharacterized protein LOC107022779 [Solanum pennellii]|uniref:Uncharacterized protein LOC107022779 n=1 Tax=Solanum pennellii TaxID=28526 RepID=A0ABM1H105_SOLPN|nr:uncharacterized protein LOC107022779 [Solanum pennellii]
MTITDRLEASANDLRSSNPGSDVIINMSKDALANGKRRFFRMFICFHALKMGFKDGLRPFIGLDGTFLKGKAKGQLLSVVGQDCKSHRYLIASAVVDKEKKRTWNWFLGHLKRSLDLKEAGEGITFISDMQKVEVNWCKTWRLEELQKVFWWCSWTTYEEDFKDKLNMIGSFYETPTEDLLKYPPNAWCRAYFDIVCKNYEVVNNFTESVNKWILEARGKPIIKMLEEIRTKVMNQLRKREDEVRLWATEFSPKSVQLFNEYMKLAQKCKVNFNGDYRYEITEGCDRHTVNMILKRYICRQWDLNGIPCPHAFSAMLYNKLDPLSKMSWWYSKEAFLRTYRYKLQPVRSENFWKVDTHQAMEPPDLVKMVGRPKTKRVKKKDEAIKRQGEWPLNTRPMKRSRKLIDEPEEINLTAPQLRPRISSQIPDFELSETSKQRSSKPYDTTLQHTIHPYLTVNFQNHDSDPTIRPMIVSENTIFRASLRTLVSYAEGSYGVELGIKCATRLQRLTPEFTKQA